MVVRGRVRNGVVVFDGAIRLQEGLEVTVVAPDKSDALRKGQGPHSILDIPAVHLGAMLRPFTRDDELFDEMLGCSHRRNKVHCR